MACAVRHILFPCKRQLKIFILIYFKNINIQKARQLLNKNVITPSLFRNLYYPFKIILKLYPYKGPSLNFLLIAIQIIE